MKTIARNTTVKHYDNADFREKLRPFIGKKILIKTLRNNKIIKQTEGKLTFVSKELFGVSTSAQDCHYTQSFMYCDIFTGNLLLELIHSTETAKQKCSPSEDGEPITKISLPEA